MGSRNDKHLAPSEDRVGEMERFLSSVNQFSVGLLKNQLKRKNRLIRTLEARLASAMENAKGQASVEIEQARLADKNEIEVLKTKLEQSQLVVRDGRMQAR
jgi:hypothetical protein